MSTTDQAVQASEQAGDSIPLQPIQARPAQDISRFLARLRFLDGVLIFIALAYAFLMAATRIGNADLFLHLATGRLIAQGAFPFSDPFTYTAPGAWVNQSWLYDLLLFQYHSLTSGLWPNGEMLTALKALGYSVLGYLLIWAGSRPEGRAWIPVCCTLLALLAMSPRALLSPMLASLLLFALLLMTLSRHTPGSRGIWAAVPICWLWAQVDSWFILGPACMILYLIGQAMQAMTSESQDSQKAWSDLSSAIPVALMSVVICLANPFHYRAFLALPNELMRWGAGAELAQDSQFRNWHLSLLEAPYYNRGIGLSPAGLALFPLAGLGLLSFALNFQKTSWWRAFLWLALLALGLLSVRAAPFFAAATAVLASLNFQEVNERALGASPFQLSTWRAWGVSGRLLTAFVALSLCIVTLPGWLQALPHSRYRVSFGLETDEGLKQAALKVAEWRKAGLIKAGEEHWFNLAPEVLSYFAWYCPGERLFIDQRFHHYKLADARDFRIATSSLQGMTIDGAEEKEGERAFQKVFKDRGVRWLVFHYYSLDRVIGSLYSLYANNADWTPCYVNGKTAIFAWHPEPGGHLKVPRALRADFAKLAFGEGATPAPGAARGIRARSLTSVILEGELPTPAEASTAHQHLVRFGALGSAYNLNSQQLLVALMAGALIGRGAALAPAPGQFPPMTRAGVFASARLIYPLRALDACGRLPLEEPIEPADQFALGAMIQQVQRSMDFGPPSSLHLGIRAARTALSKSPEDATTLLLLGELYSTIKSRSREAPFLPTLPPAQLIRHSQTVTPLVTLLSLKPEDSLIRQRAHRLLLEAFRSPEYLDQQAYHLGELLRLGKATGRLPQVPADQVPKLLEAMAKELQGLNSQIQSNRKLYEVQSAGKPIVQRVHVALRQGLSEEALRVLASATPEELSDDKSGSGLQLLVNLLLGLGRVEEARGLLQPPPGTSATFDPRAFGQHPFGMPAYEYFLAQMFAAAGDYEAADKALAALGASARRGAGMQRFLASIVFEATKEEDHPDNVARLTARAMGEMVLSVVSRSMMLPYDFLAHAPFTPYPPFIPRIPDPRVYRRQIIQYSYTLIGAEADALAMRAWLAVEQGRMKDAKQLAEQALDLGGNRREISFRSSILAQHVLVLCQAKDPVLP
jgi:hypothetical protein